MLDLKSTLVAGAIGGLAIVLVLWNHDEVGLCAKFAAGFIFGAVVQTGVRLTGVS